jgi:predicted MFS family arabinose efflux permease
MKTGNTDSRVLFLRGLCVWLLATLFYFFDNLLNVVPGAINSELRAIFNLSPSQLGLLASCYAWPYGLMQIPVGIMMDRFSPRKLLTLASILCTLGCILFAVAEQYIVACLSRILIGFGASFAVIGCAKISTIWFSSRLFALFMGLMVSVGMFGAAVGLSSVQAITDAFGWRQTMFLATAVSIVITVLIWTVIKDRPEQQTTSSANTKMPAIWPSLLEIVRSPQSWIIAIYAGLMFVPTQAFGALWGVPFLQEAFNFTEIEAGQLNSLIFVGWIFGGPIYGWFSDYIGKRNIPMYIANIASLIVISWLIYGRYLPFTLINFSFISIAIAMFLIGFFSSGFVIAFVAIKELNRKSVSGTVIGYINTINTLSVAALQWLIGIILSWLHTGDTPSYIEFEKALFTVPLCLIISLILLCFVRETNCKSLD